MRRQILGAWVLVAALAWIYLLTGAGMGMSGLEMTRQSNMGMDMMPPGSWDMSYITLMFFMWWIMMIAMMLPSATPMILLFAAVNRKKRHKGDTFVPTGIFASGYIIVWGLFSVAAVTLQWGFERSGLMSSMMMETTSLAVGGTLLVAAGLWQLTYKNHWFST